MLGGRIAGVLLALSLIAQPVLADARVEELTKALQSSSAKSRIAAVTALGRLEDRAALRPLVEALHDPNTQVRTIAAAALGKLGHKAALPALKNAAQGDSDADVRKQAKEAAILVAKANRLPEPFPTVQAATKPSVRARKSGGTAGFGRQAHAVEPRPDLFVTINSSADDSPGRTDKNTRKLHGEIIRETLHASFKATPLVTTVAADARRWGLDPRHLDLSVTKLETQTVGAYVEIEAQLRLAISDDAGRMLSFVSGGAKVQVPKRTFHPKYLANLRREALENAMRGLYDKLLRQLRDRSQS